jgi:hypothetical protein
MPVDDARAKVVYAINTEAVGLRTGLVILLLLRMIRYHRRSDNAFRGLGWPSSAHHHVTGKNDGTDQKKNLGKNVTTELSMQVSFWYCFRSPHQRKGRLFKFQIGGRSITSVS